MQDFQASKQKKGTVYKVLQHAKTRGRTNLFCSISTPEINTIQQKKSPGFKPVLSLYWNSSLKCYTGTGHQMSALPRTLITYSTEYINTTCIIKPPVVPSLIRAQSQQAPLLTDVLQQQLIFRNCCFGDSSLTFYAGRGSQEVLLVRLHSQINSHLCSCRLEYSLIDTAFPCASRPWFPKDYRGPFHNRADGQATQDTIIVLPHLQQCIHNSVSVGATEITVNITFYAIIQCSSNSGYRIHYK